MGSRRVPNSKHSRSQQWSDQEVQRFQSYMSQALNHSMGRNGRVVKVLCYLSLMDSHGQPWGSESHSSVSAAIFQNYSAFSGQQAAHYLPGQLKINGKRISHFVNDPKTKQRIDCLFGDVDSLPANFNKADSEAEAKGLCRALAASAKAIINRSPTQPGAIDRTHVRLVYRTIWVPRARRAIQMALEKKRQKYTQPDLNFGQAGGVHFDTIMNLSKRESATNYQRNITQQCHILEKYLEAMYLPPRELQDSHMKALEKEVQR